jgi:hypothetical protein
MDTFTPRLDVLPRAQRLLWRKLQPIQRFGYVLYGGTAIALRRGHRQSVDFDFSTSHPVDSGALRAALPFLRMATVRQERPNTYEVETGSGVRVAFFGGLDFGRVGQPEQTDDGVLQVASLDDLMATKVKDILQRSESKDYRDIAAMLRAGVRLETGLAAAQKMYHPTFSPAEALKAVVYFEDGDMARLSKEDRAGEPELLGGHVLGQVTSARNSRLPRPNDQLQIERGPHPGGLSRRTWEVRR